ncbi:MAG: hypothetical protein LLG09_02950 [Negativicutes bacterium]|nr:hypothetical protein [Negativicutes bacterium]
MPQTNSYEQLLHETAVIVALQPWNQFRESDVFAIEHPKTHLLYFVSIFGQNGLDYGFSLAKGYEAYLNLQEWLSQTDEKIKPNQLALYLMQLAGFREMTDADWRLLQKAGSMTATAKGYPRFKDYTPEYLPWLINDTDAALLCRLLPQVRQVIVRAEKDRALIDSAKGCLIRRLLHGIWQDDYQAIMPKERQLLSYLRPENPEVIQSLPSKPDLIFECSLVLSLKPIRLKEGERPFYPWIFLLIDAGNGRLIDYQLTSKAENFAAISMSLLRVLQKAGCRPSEIKTGSEMARTILSGICQELGIPVSLTSLRYAPELMQMIQNKL